MILNECRILLRQVKRGLGDVEGEKLGVQTGFSTRAEQPGTITICPGDFQHIEDVQHDLKVLFVGLWAFKDHLVELLKTKMSKKEAKDLVENYVDETPILQIVSDVANTAKHPVPHKTRTGRYARIGHYGTRAPVLMPWDDQETTSKKIESEAKAYVNIEDKDGKKIDDAVSIASQAIQAWEDFILKHNLGV